MRVEATIEIERENGHGDYSCLPVTVVGEAEHDDFRREYFVLDTDDFDLICGDWRGSSRLPGLTLKERARCFTVLEERLEAVIAGEKSERDNRAYDAWRDRHLHDKETT